ncbi:MAG: leucyl/phenylalanyl-tRNA--protein transferase [Treponema sp.]|jgi:leucyl/phenylalanyl-tRNA--protein transferase|nr:leucyl/phenylalanyl-tRNA--protein transferase [Treponema sp.]
MRGPDPDFPYLGENDRYRFPDPAKAEDSIIAVGGNLSPGMLLSAYEQGIFPWYNAEDPVLWQSPDPRFLLFPGKLHVSRSMQKTLRGGRYRISFNENFEGVIRGCSEIDRPGQGGTWISEDVISAYLELHGLGYAFSAESSLDGELAGGCYGVLLGRVFCGESMFAKKPDASKAAFISLAEKLFYSGLAFIDCQVPTPHLRSLGAEEVPRTEFLRLLAAALA